LVFPWLGGVALDREHAAQVVGQAAGQITGALAHLAGFVTLVEDPADLRGVSSTLAREELRREGGEGEEEEEDGGGNGGAARGVVTGGSWLVPPAVAEEARRRGLYR
jgi:hypothetical protein